MGNIDDAFELLCRSDPVDETRLPDHQTPTAQQLLARILSEPRQAATPDRPRRLSGRRLRVAVALALVALATIAAAWIAIRAISDPIAIGCYQALTLDSDRVAVASGGQLDPSVCAPIWEEQTLTNQQVAPAGSVPPLLGCVTDTGSLAVFPSDDPTLCEDLGLSRPDDQSIPEGDAIRQLNDQLIAYFDRQACVPFNQAQLDIESILKEMGFGDWTIEVEVGDPDYPCASFGLDTQQRTIHLIPIPG
jgi:hypothetical protein